MAAFPPVESRPEALAARTRHAVAAAALALLSAWIFARFWSHPEELLNWRFLTHDLASQLHLSDQLLAGKRLYADVFSQYGPVPASVHLAAAYLFGSTALTFMVLEGCLAIVCLIQIYILLRRTAPAWWSIVFTAIALLPWVPSTGGGPGAYLQPYGGMERVVLLAIALAWRPLTGRTVARNVVLGLLLGLLPWIKFGSAFVAGAALLGADVLVLFRRREFRRACWRAILAANAWVLAGFLGGQSALAIYLVVTQPPAIAKDVLWPSYMLENYAGYVTSDIRFVQWQNAGYFIGAQLPVLAAVLAFFVLIWPAMATTSIERNASSNRAPETFGAFIFLFLFWFIGLAGYLAHVWLIMGYAWLSMVGAGYALTFLGPRLRLAALCLWLPCFFLTAKGVAPGRAPPASNPVIFENGETLWLDAVWQKRVTLLSDFLAKERTAAVEMPPTIMGIPTSGGLAHYFRCPVLTRQSWFLPGFVRPYDEEAIRESLAKTAGLVVFSEKPMELPFPANANQWGFGPIFSDALATEIPRRFAEPVKLDAFCWALKARQEP